MPRDTTKARRALDKKRSEERRQRAELEKRRQREQDDPTCRWSKACTTNRIEGSPFCYLHSKATIGEARAYTSPDDTGAALLFPEGRSMGTSSDLVTTVRAALEGLER